MENKGEETLKTKEITIGVIAFEDVVPGEHLTLGGEIEALYTSNFKPKEKMDAIKVEPN